jgi:hypothetical protein
MMNFYPEKFFEEALSNFKGPPHGKMDSYTRILLEKGKNLKMDHFFLGKIF